MEYRGVKYEIVTRATAWGTYTSEVHIQINAHEGRTLTEASTVEGDDLTKQYGSEEEARNAVEQLAKHRIDRSLKTRGKA